MNKFSYKGYEITQEGNVYSIEKNDGGMWETKNLIEILQSIDAMYAMVFSK